MSTLRTLAATRPVLAAVSCAALQFLLTTAILKAGIAFAPPAAFGQVKLLAFASTVLLPLVLVQVLGMWREIGAALARVRPGGVFAASLLLCLVFLPYGVQVPAAHPLVPELVIQTFNAFGEELLFRGVIFTLLLTRPRWQGIALSGVLFGAMHLIHGFMDGNWTHALWWAMATSLSGMMFAAVRYGTGSLTLTMLLHMVLNLAKLYSNTEPAAGAGALALAEQLEYGIEVALVVYVVWRGHHAAPRAEAAR
jgi:membrane protease YdiL (CAAX protease family)